MSDSIATYTDSPNSSVFNKRALLFLIFFGLFALFFNLDGRSIENKDYLRYAEVAREILELDDWVMLHENGKIYVHKPPLHFWKIAGAYKLFGVGPFAARLPAAIAAFCGLLIAFFFGKRLLRSPEIGFLAAVILLSAYGYFWWARRTRIDMEYAVLFSLSLILFYCGCETTNRKFKALWYLAFWLATGFAFMDKAFIAFSNLLVVVPYGMMCILKSEKQKFAPGLLAVTSIAVLAPVLPWILSLLNHPQFADYWEIFMKTKIMERRMGLFFYLHQFPLKFFPASPFFLMGVWAYLKYRKQLTESPELAFVLLWTGAIFFILHWSPQKNHRYLLPIFLPGSMISAWAVWFFYQKNDAVFCRLIQWGDRIVLVITTLSLISPFIVAWYLGLSWVGPLPLVLCLAFALILTRIFLPLKLAAIFVSFVILFHVIEVNDTLLNEKRAVYLRMSQVFSAQGLTPGEIAFHGDSTRAQEGVGYYLNRLMRYSNNWKALIQDSNIKGIVTTREEAQKRITWKAGESGGQIVPLDKGLVLIIKRK